METFYLHNASQICVFILQYAFSISIHANTCADIQPGRNLSTLALFHILFINFNHQTFCPVLWYSYFVIFLVHHQATDTL